jgi:flagellar hook-associated protein 3 FlgL
MRTSTPLQFNRALNGVLTLQGQVQKYQLQISSGKRLASAADDPVAAAQTLNISERLTAIDQFNRNANLVELRLNDQETAMTSATNLVQRTRELILQGKSRSLGTDDRRFLAAEMRQRLEELVSLGNTRNASGEHIFSGTAVDTVPFTVNAAGDVVFNGNENVRQLSISENRTLAEGFSGIDVFMGVRNGNGTFVMDVAPANTGTGRLINDALTNAAGYVPHDFRIQFTAADTFDVINDTTGATVLSAQPYSPGAAISFNGLSVAVTGTPATGDAFTVAPSENQSVFATLKNVIAAMELDATSPALSAQQTFDLDRGLTDIDQVLSNLISVRASVGARSNTIESQQKTNEDLSTQLRTVKSRLEDADPVEAISELARHSQVLEAAQQAFVRVQGLSLFNFL